MKVKTGVSMLIRYINKVRALCCSEILISIILHIGLCFHLGIHLRLHFYFYVRHSSLCFPTSFSSFPFIFFTLTYLAEIIYILVSMCNLKPTASLLTIFTLTHTNIHSHLLISILTHVRRE